MVEYLVRRYVFMYVEIYVDMYDLPIRHTIPVRGSGSANGSVLSTVR